MGTEPNDAEPPPEELEMAVEEALGRPMAGNPVERLEALTKRVKYLTAAIRGASDRNDLTEVRRLQRELAAANVQLADWNHQNEGRN